MTPSNGVGAVEPPVNWRNFHKACRLAQLSDATTAMFTGKGEPTLFPDQITKYLQEIQPYRFPLLELQSNGIRAGKGDIDYFLKQWYDLGLTTFAISVVHCKASLNQTVYTPKSQYFDLPALIDKLHGVGLSVRLAAVLVKGYLDNPDSIGEMIEFARQHQVEQLTLRPVNRTEEPKNDNAKDRGIHEWAAANQLSKDQVAAIAAFLNRNGTPLMNLVHRAVVYDVKNQNVCWANSLTRDPNKEEQRQLIFFPSGQLFYDWQYAGARIL
jgi:hypothetical protein